MSRLGAAQLAAVRAAAAERASAGGLAVHVDANDEVLELSARPALVMGPAELLSRNAGLGSARLVLDPRDDAPVLVVEAFVNEASAELAAHEALDDIWDAASSLRAVSAPRTDGSCSARGSESLAGSVTHAAAAAGYEVHERDDGTLVIDLESASTFHQAELDAGATRLRVALKTPADTAHTSAVAAFLLRATAHVRHVRAVCADAATLSGLALEVALPRHACAEAACRALGALTLATRMLWATAEALVADAAVAGIYSHALPVGVHDQRATERPGGSAPMQGHDPHQSSHTTADSVSA